MLQVFCRFVLPMTKKLLPLWFIFLFFNPNSWGQQKCFQLNDTANLGMPMYLLDAQYKWAMSDSSNNGAFPFQMTNSLFGAWLNFMDTLNHFVNKKGFKWHKDKKKNKVYAVGYFQPNGNLDYFFYEFRTPFPQEKQKEYQGLAEEFIKTYLFELKINVPFKQCGTTYYYKNL